MSEKFLSPPQVARLLRVAPDHVLTLIRSGRLKASNLSLGGDRPRWKVNPADLQSFLDGASNQVPPKPDRRRSIPKPLKQYI
jgi:hypothetical protein